MSSQPFDTIELRQTLGAFVTGVTVITAVDRDGKAYGLTANSFTSVSLNPPLVLWNQSLTAPSYPIFRDAERFAVNILADDQIDVSKRFSTPANGGDRFAGLGVRAGLGGIPLIEGCAAYIECRKESSFPGGDHAVFLGRVEKVGQSTRKPLVFGGGKYLAAHPHDGAGLALDLGIGTLSHLHAVRLATPMLTELSRRLDKTLALCVWGNHGPTVTRWEVSREPVSFNLPTGLVLPVLRSASGLAFAAYLPRSMTCDLIESELRQAPAGMDSLDELLAGVRADGVATLNASDSFHDMYGTHIDAASVPVFDSQGMIALAFTMLDHPGALHCESGAAALLALKETGAALSHRLGYRSPLAAAG
jgi:flavin reductase (DIM6/NTAB) family NADH-FMN oxidoreductase RutF/DNA-binding IclR family transcriptional regulator